MYQHVSSASSIIPHDIMWLVGGYMVRSCTTLLECSEHTALEGQDLPCTHRAHYELQSDIAIIIMPSNVITTLYIISPRLDCRLLSLTDVATQF